MFTFTRHQCRVTAFALLALFGSALGLLSLCAVWCGPMHGPGGVLAVAASPKGAPHSCCAQKAKSGAETTGKSSKKADCCAHEKAAKWAAVPDGPLTKLLKDGVPALDLPPGAPDGPPARWAGTWDCTLAVRLVPPHHLPPKIPDLRVFLHSLLV